MKKGLLRTLSAVVAISMLMCMSLVAFADTASTLTTTASITNYDVATGNVTVTTTVSNAVASEQVAFLVEKTTDESTEIIWIDQQTANADRTATSTFTAAVGKAEGAKVRVGTSSIAASDSSTDTIEFGSYTVAWSVANTNTENPSKVVAVAGTADDTDGSATVSQKTGTVTFYVFPAAGEELVSVTENSTQLETIGNEITRPVNANATYVFTFDTKTIAAETAPTVVKNPSTDVSVTKYGENGSTYASVPAKATNAKKFGIIVATKESAFTGLDNLDEFNALPDGSDITNADDAVEVIKLPALGANADGLFVIQINDSQNTFFTGAKYVAKIYAVNDMGVALSAETYELN